MHSKIGTVISAKNEKTITVAVNSYKIHPKYKKRHRVTKKFYAHDPEKNYKAGDTVTIYETRPLSKLKRWTVINPSNATQP